MSPSEPSTLRRALGLVRTDPQRLVRRALDRRPAGPRWLRPLQPHEVVICTVHGNSERYDRAAALQWPWPELQMARLRRHTAAGFRVLAYGNRLIEEHEAYLRSCPEVTFSSSRDLSFGEWEHVWPVRNWLVRQAVDQARLVVNLDSDAFPVADDWVERVWAALTPSNPVVAVQRPENGDHHSDRCFVAFTRSGWRRHAFDFSPLGRIDAGGDISTSLEARGLTWTALRRTNAHSYHPIVASIHGDLVYHHAAGSRPPRFRGNAAWWTDDAEMRREDARHHLLRQRLFADPDRFLGELRGSDAPVDLEAMVDAQLADPNDP